MIYTKAIKQTTTQEIKTNITITDNDMSKSIATEIEKATGTHREAFANETGPAVINITAAARVTPPSSVIDATPLRGPLRRETTEVPPAAQT